MGKLVLEITEEPIIGNAGLAALGELMRISDMDFTCAKRVSLNYQVAEKDSAKKEGIAKGYNGVLGDAPVCSFLEGGLVAGAKLCPGNHSLQHEGALDVHVGGRSRVRKLTKARLLWVDDAAFDDVALMAARSEAGDSFITRHNLRREKPEILINLAMQEGRAHSPRPGKTVYTGCTRRDREGIGSIRLVYEVIERASKKGQTLLLPESKVFSVWTDPEKVSDADILRLYRDRGTCEQYFAELNSELDLERLPSGKFSVTEFFFQFGVLANNMLRVLGESLLDSGIIGLKKATRRRLRTIMQGLMYSGERFVRHARRVVVKVVSNGGFGEALVGMQKRLAQA